MKNFFHAFVLSTTDFFYKKPMRYMDILRKNRQMGKLGHQITQLSKNTTFEQGPQNLHNVSLTAEGNSKKYASKWGWQAFWQALLSIFTNFVLFYFIKHRDTRREELKKIRQHVFEQSSNIQSNSAELDMKIWNNQSRLSFFNSNNQNEIQEYQKKESHLKAQLLYNIKQQQRFLDLIEKDRPFRQNSQDITQQKIILKNLHEKIEKGSLEEQIEEIKNLSTKLKNNTLLSSSDFSNTYHDLVHQLKENFKIRIQNLSLIDYRKGGYSTALEKMDLINHPENGLNNKCATSLGFSGLLCKRIASSANNINIEQEFRKKSLHFYAEALNYDSENPLLLSNIASLLKKTNSNNGKEVFCNDELIKTKKLFEEFKVRTNTPNFDKDKLSSWIIEYTVSRTPQDLDVLNNYALFLSQNGEHILALKHISQALKDSPKNPALLNNRGIIISRVFEKQDKPEISLSLKDAKNDLKQANNIKPGDESILYNLGKVYFQQGNHHKAIDCFKQSNLKNHLVKFWKSFSEYMLDGNSNNLKSLKENLEKISPEHLIVMDEDIITIEVLKKKIDESLALQPTISKEDNVKIDSSKSFTQKNALLCSRLSAIFYEISEISDKSIAMEKHPEKENNLLICIEKENSRKIFKK